MTAREAAAFIQGGALAILPVAILDLSVLAWAAVAMALLAVSYLLERRVYRQQVGGQ